MIITFLFTPYGYKFEGKDVNNRILESYRYTGVEWPNKGIWKFVMSGLIDVGSESFFRFVDYFSEYWSSTEATNNSNQTYHFWGKVYEIHPSTTDTSNSGFSVRCIIS